MPLISFAQVPGLRLEPFKMFFPRLVLFLLSSQLAHASDTTLPTAESGSGKGEAHVLNLEQALRIGLSANFDLQVETLNPRIARAEAAVAGADFDPRLSAVVSWAESKSAQAASVLEGAAQPEDRNMQAEANLSKRFSPGTEITAGTGFNRFETNSANALLDPDYRSDFGVEIRQPLLRDFGTQVNVAPLRRAEAGFARSRIVYEAALAEFFDSLIRAYWEVSAARKRLELSQSSIDLARTILDRTNQEYDLGIATRSDILQAEAELATRMEFRLGFEKDLADRRDRLRFLLGEDLTQSAEAFETSALPEPPSPPDSLSGVLSGALAFDPRRRALEKERDQRFLDFIVADNTTRPDLDLFLGGDYQGREEQFSESYNGALERDGYRWRVGLELSFPWGFEAQKARKQQNVLRLRQTEIRIEEASAQVRRSVRDAWRQLENGRAQLETARTTVRLREEVLQAEEARRERGLADINDVLNAARQLDNARLREVDAVLATILAHTRLGRLDGNIFERNGFGRDQLIGQKFDSTATAAREFRP